MIYVTSFSNIFRTITCSLDLKCYRMDVPTLNMFWVQYSLLLQYEILEKLVTCIVWNIFVTQLSNFAKQLLLKEGQKLSSNKATIIKSLRGNDKSQQDHICPYLLIFTLFVVCLHGFIMSTINHILIFNDSDIIEYHIIDFTMSIISKTEPFFFQSPVH